MTKKCKNSHKETEDHLRLTTERQNDNGEKKQFEETQNNYKDT